MSRLRVIEVDRPAQTERMSSPGERPWWQLCGIDEFKSRVAVMPRHHVQSLISEIAAAIAITSSVVNDVEREHDHRQRARRALAHMVEKRRLLKSVVEHVGVDAKKQRQEEHGVREQTRNNRVGKAREALAQGDVTTALSHVLDILDRTVE